MHQVQLNAVECNLWISNYSTSLYLFCFCKVDSTQGALSLSDTDAMAHLPADHRANNLADLDGWGLQSWTVILNYASYVNKWILLT